MSRTAIDPICADCDKPVRGNIIWTDDESAFHPDCYPHGKEFGVNFKRAGEYVASIRAQAYREGQERMRERLGDNPQFIASLYDFICDDVLPAFGVSKETARGDVELWSLTEMVVERFLSQLEPEDLDQ